MSNQETASTQDIIAGLKALGLDPERPDMDKFEDDRILELLRALEGRKSDPAAQDYILAMNGAINQLDTVGYVKPRD